MAGIKPLKTKGVPIDYMDIQTLWNDRRTSHINPLASPPRREEARCPRPHDLPGLVDAVYRSGPPADTEAHYPLANKRLYGGR